MGSLAALKNLRPLTDRERTLDDMLDHYKDATETLHSGQGQDLSKPGVGPRMSPYWWNESYRELERCLKWLRKHGHLEPVRGELSRTYYWHVSEWYLRCHRVKRPYLRQDKRGRLYQHEIGKVKQWKIVVVRNPEAEPGRVLEGLGLMAAVFAGRPDLSLALREIAQNTRKVA